MIPKNDTIVVGLIAALLVPFVGYALLIQIGDWLSDAYQRSVIFTPRTLSLVAICCNAILMAYFQRRYFRKAMRGVFIVTMILAVAWFILFGVDLIFGGAEPL